MNLTVNTTTGDVNAFDASAAHATGAMSTAMKTYYDTELLENARPRLIFTQLGKSQFLPAGHGDSVQIRYFDPGIVHRTLREKRDCLHMTA